MKKGLIFFIIASLSSLYLTASFASALGISPAIIEINYVPGEKHEVDLVIHGPDPNRMIDVYAEGEAAEFITLDKTRLQGGGTVRATITMPAQMDTPGKNRFYIAAAEEPYEDRFLGAAVIIKSTVVIHVPYPGKYIEAALSIPNSNLDQKIPVELKVVNRGTSILSVAPKINFYDSSGTFVQSMEFKAISLVTGQEEHFRRYLDTTGLKPDDYLAEAVINYGPTKRINHTFKLGDLNVEIINFTEEIDHVDLAKFFVRVKNNWNGRIKSVYADVSVFNKTHRSNFRTPPVDLEGWEEKDIVGYFETESLSASEYDMDIIVNYMAQSGYASGKLTVNKRQAPIALIIGAVFLIIVLATIVYLLTRKKSAKK